MAERRLPERELKLGDEVPFTARTERFGRAEFMVCLRYLQGEPSEVFVTPLQQPDATESFRLRIYGKTFRFASWTHKGIRHPNVWLYFWCQEHHCPAFRAYVPLEATHLTVPGDGDIIFDRIDG